MAARAEDRDIHARQITTTMQRIDRDRQSASDVRLRLPEASRLRAVSPMSRCAARTAALALLGVTLGATGGRLDAQDARDRILTVRELMSSWGVAPWSGAPADLDGPAVNAVIENELDLFVIAFYVSSQPGSSAGETLRVGGWDPTTKSWKHATSQRVRGDTSEWDLGALRRITHTSRNVFIDTDVNPSAGRLVVFTRELTPVVVLPGWLTGSVADDAVVYQRSATHFVPTHSAELWTWNPATRRDERLYPTPPPGDSLRRAYVDTVRAIYQRVGSTWFQANNHHMDPERFDSSIDGVLVMPDKRTVVFVVEFGGGEGTPAATPRIHVRVRCQNVGSDAARCAEERW